MANGKAKHKIPKPQAIPDAKIKPKYDFEKIKDKNHIIFSFENLDFTNEYFGLDGTCENWSKNLFEKIRDISALEDAELRKPGNSTLRFHDHSNGKAKFEPPPTVSKEDFYQIRLGKSKGGIHGVLYENIFYVFWLDPHHNMYPDERYGGLKKIKPPLTCCKDRDEELSELNKRIKYLEGELATFEELLNEK